MASRYQGGVDSWCPLAHLFSWAVPTGVSGSRGGNTTVDRFNEHSTQTIPAVLFALETGGEREMEDVAMVA